MSDKEDSVTSFETSSEIITESSESIKPKRGRPKKAVQTPQSQYNPSFNTPLGYHYATPRIFPITVGYNNALYKPPMFRTYWPAPCPARGPRMDRPSFHEAEPPQRREPVSRKKRRAALEEEEEAPVIEAEPSEEGEMDRIEKILDFKEDRYLVKFRDQSYLHCEFVERDEIAQTRAGAIKLKRFRPREEGPSFNSDNITVEKILCVDGNNFLVKWKGLPYEHSTWESEANLNKINESVNPENLTAESFKIALAEHKKMRIQKVSKYPIDWRPLHKINIQPEFKSPTLSLRSYQLEGLNWLINKWHFRQSCIMADEMGLGKTVQSVVFVDSLFNAYSYCTPVLIVSPLSTLIHWEREFKTWTDLRVLTFHASLSGRELIYNYEFGRSPNYFFDVLLLTYETAISSVKFLSEIEFGVGIFDEAHKLKNASSKAATVLRSLSIHHKVLLTGTPLQNNLNELWSLLNFISPGNFPSLANFLEEFKMEKEEDVDRLQQLLRPLMLRRMKEDVEKSIPLKEETIIEVELTMIQKRYYKAILEKNLDFLKKGSGEGAPNLLNTMMELRKCCIHPYLIKGAEETILNEELKRRYRGAGLTKANSDTAQDSTTGDIDSITIQNVNAPPTITEQFSILIAASGKLVLLDKLLQKLHGSHKVLIFSQMTKCLDILSDYLTFRRYKFERIDGAVRGEQRQASIDRFTTTDCFVFLLCTRAGGVGINLTAADTVIIFDSDWNPQNDLQAQARCHRIGQTSEVKIYRLITRNTYEREMFDKAGLKLGLDKAILASSVQVKKKKDAVEILLKKGAYGVLMETDEQSRKFCEEDIDQILERRTKIVRHLDGGNVFSKATFQVEEEMDDPNFWENLLSKKSKDEKEGRIKRQMRRVAREANLSAEEVVEIDTLLAASIATNTTDNKGVDDIESNGDIGINSNIDNTGDGNTGISGNGIGNTGNTGINSNGDGNIDTKIGSNIDTKIGNISIDTKHNTIDTNAIDTEITIQKPILVFLTALRKGYKSLNTLPFDAKPYFSAILKYLFEKIAVKKLREDISLYTDRLIEETDEQISPDPLYEKYGMRMLLRIQVPLILQAVLKNREVVPTDNTRGWTIEDDKRLVKHVLAFGYDNFPSSVGCEKGFLRGKSADDLNQRVRKIILSVKEDEDKSENPEIFNTVLLYGKVTDDNRKNIEEHLKETGATLEEIESLIQKVTQRRGRRRPEEELVLLDRINLIDRFLRLTEMPNVKKSSGLPRKWTVQNDLVLQDVVRRLGLSERGLEESGFKEDVILKRMDVLIKASLDEE